MKKLNRVALVGSTLALVALIALMMTSLLGGDLALAQTTTTAAATTAATTTTPAATTAVATTAATTTVAATTAATTTTAAATAAASTKGANTGLPFYTPSKPANFTQAAQDAFDKAFKDSGGPAAANAKTDLFFSPDGEAKVSAYYDNAMKAIGFNPAGKNSTSADGLNGNAYVYSNGKAAYIVTFLGPLTADQATGFASQLKSGTAAANDTLVILISGIDLTTAQGGAAGVTPTPTPVKAPAPASAPATGLGGVSEQSDFNPNWLLILLALVMAMSGAALLIRHRSTR